MLEAWRLTMDDMRLADRDFWLRCNRLIHRQDSKVDKDALANADTYVEADSANVMSAEKPVFNERRRSSYISSDERVASVSSIKARKMFCPWWEQKKDEHNLSQRLYSMHGARLANANVVPPDTGIILALHRLQS